MILNYSPFGCCTHVLSGDRNNFNIQAGRAEQIRDPRLQIGRPGDSAGMRI